MTPAPQSPVSSPAQLLSRGKIAYRDAQGAETGREWFDLWQVPGGHLLRALCVIDADGQGGGDLVRDVSLAMDEHWRPRDGWSRVMAPLRGDDALWFRVGEKDVLVDSRLDGKDKPQALLALGTRLPYLGLHPLQGDALVAMARGRDAPGEYRAVLSATNSVSPNGDGAPGGQTLDIQAAWIGEEELEVPAGRFAADHFRLIWRCDWPPADVWVRRGDCLFLKMVWPVVPGDFVLEELAQI